MTIQQNDLYSISTVTLNKECFEKYNLLPKQLFYWLYYFQKNLMCISTFSLTDLSLKNSKEIESNYLQPYIILQGSNKFNLNRKYIEAAEINNLILLDNKYHN